MAFKRRESELPQASENFGARPCRFSLAIVPSIPVDANCGAAPS
jgi:hypothetical protein